VTCRHGGGTLFPAQLRFEVYRLCNPLSYEQFQSAVTCERKPNGRLVIEKQLSSRQVKALMAMFQQQSLVGDVTLEELPPHMAYSNSLPYSPYGAELRVLTLGDGNFTFSVALAQAMCQRTNYGGACNLVATSLDSVGALQGKYGALQMEQTFEELSCRGVTVLQGVDSSSLRTSLPTGGIVSSWAGDVVQIISKFDRIVWNFPHCSPESDDDHNLRHHNLLKSLFLSCQEWLSQEAEIHITLLGKQAVRWGLGQAAAAAGFCITASYKFDPALFPGYKPVSEVGFNKKFPISPARTFVFKSPQLRREWMAREWMEKEATLAREVRRRALQMSIHSLTIPTDMVGILPNPLAIPPPPPPQASLLSQLVPRIPRCNTTNDLFDDSVALRSLQLSATSMLHPPTCVGMFQSAPSPAPLYSESAFPYLHY